MELFHIGLTVADIARSVRFYVDVVGFEEAAPVEHDSVEFGHLTGNPGARISTVMLSGGGLRLQLNEYLDGAGPRLDVHHNTVGAAHLAFFVADVGACHDALTVRGDVMTDTAPVTNATARLRSFYVEDPDGIPIEFLERLKAPVAPACDRRSAATTGTRTGGSDGRV